VERRATLEMVRRHLADEVIDGETYWYSSSMRTVAPAARAAHLLPLYDEYLISYTDRTAALDPALWRPIVARDPFTSAVVLEGRVVAGWKRTRSKDVVTIALDLPAPLKRNDMHVVVEAAHRHGRFLGLDVALDIERTPAAG
jgi:hypothetical protein